MSVARITEQYLPPLDEIKAWKVFECVGGSPFGLFFPHWYLSDSGPNKYAVPTNGHFLQSIPKTVRTLAGQFYETGFHVFETKEGAEEWSEHSEGRKVVPVQVRGVRLKFLHCREGRHKDVPTIVGYVADQMKVSSE